MKYLYFLLVVALISSCATSYQSQGMTGDYALLRASELTLEKGYKYFVVASDNQNKKSGVATIGGNTATTTGNINSFGNFNARTNYSSPTYVPINKYENTLVYEMLNEKVEGVFVYDAQLIYDSLSAKYIK